MSPARNISPVFVRARCSTSAPAKPECSKSSVRCWICERNSSSCYPPPGNDEKLSDLNESRPRISYFLRSLLAQQY